jgi:hypothetical protein
MKLTLSTFASIILLSLSVSHAKADTQALSFTGGTTLTANNGFTVGWSFTLGGPVTLTSLGVYDGVQNGAAGFSGSPGDGLAQAHTINLWTEAGTLVASVVVPGGTAAPLLGGFRYASVSPLLLAGGNYVIAAVFPNVTSFVNADTVVGLASSLTMASGVTFTGARIVAGDGFPQPLPPAGNGEFGPNFQFTSAPSAVPENGASGLLLCLGAGALFGIRVARVL